MENKKRKLNIIDIALILTVIAIIGGTVFRTYGKNNLFSSTDDVVIEYILEIKSTDKDFRHSINVGDNIYLYSNKNICGTVVACEKNPSKTYVKSNHDTMIVKYNPASIDIFITVRTDARKSDNGYFINAADNIVVGKKQKFYTNNFEFDAQVKKITDITSSLIG